LISTGFVLLLFGFLFFVLGILQCVSSRKFLGYLLGLEIIINAANLNLAAWIDLCPIRTDIEPMILMVIGFAAIETAVALSIFAWASKQLRTVGSPLSI
jgi:NADH:ubiquinone oxidoreductase subunit K